jgi:hypothetical protein
VTCLVILPCAVTAWAKSGKVEICQKGHDISVSRKAIRAHLGHGDSVGGCNPTCTAGCSLISDPVTFANGHTYANACFAEMRASPTPRELGMRGEVGARDPRLGRSANRCGGVLPTAPGHASTCVPHVYPHMPARSAEV